MQLILHAGAHCTDDDRLLRTLIRNAADLRASGVAIPKPSAYRKLLTGAMHALTGAQPAADAQAVMMRTIMGSDRDPVRRLVLSSESFFTVPKLALDAGQIYPRAGERMRNLQKLFQGCDITLCLGLRNPATWLQAVYAATPHDSFRGFLNGSDIHVLRWYDLIQRIRAETPSVSVIAWCNEDTPLLWADIARRMLGVDPGTRISGGFDLLGEIMTPEGMQRFRAYLQSHPDMTEVQKRRVMVAFLEKFALPGALEEELDLPGWTQDVVAELSAAYDQDVQQIAGLPGVSLVVP